MRHVRRSAFAGEACECREAEARRKLGRRTDESERATITSVIFVGADASVPAWRSLNEVVPLRFVNIGDLLSDLDVRLGGGQGAIVRSRLATLAGETIWYQPGQFDMLPESLVSEVDSSYNFLARQFSVALSFVENWLEAHALCVDKPSTQRRWSNRVLQLTEIARAHSDALPQTRIGVSTEETPPGYLLKRLSESRRVAADLDFLAQIPEPTEVASLRRGSPTPVLIQEVAYSDTEYRTFVLGRHSVTVALPRDRGAPLDIHADFESFKKARIAETLQPDLWESVQRALELNFFAVDYVLVEGGWPLIFEVNPLFSWEWLPTLVCRQVEEVIASALATELRR